MAKKATAKKARATKPTATTATATIPGSVPVRISMAGVLLPSVVIVRVGQDLIWIAQNGGGPWTVTFDGGSPFSESKYRVPRGGTVSTRGGVKGPAGKIYRYTVSDESGRITDEGEVVVE